MFLRYSDVTHVERTLQKSRLWLKVSTLQSRVSLHQRHSDLMSSLGSSNEAIRSCYTYANFSFTGGMEKFSYSEKDQGSTNAGKIII